MNEQNLVTQAQRTPEERKRIARMGGKRKAEVWVAAKQRQKDLCAIMQEKPIESDLLRTIDAILLNMTNAQLKGVAENEELPTYARRRARLLLQPDDKEAFEVSERLIDRVAGKPKQQVDAQLSAAQPVIVKDDGLD